ncbi:hypothetical protein OG601_15455 [Streptomyces sp. NBC_01239]|uniref:hypothetical protein n=1 Tax=Streptomyces sp. NBC_01239 TaxID=2903792 RepID=UPI002255A51D|nr:hypothetical protein [Streptomyces sp. NBC_01239]MCX4812002.1 hypothetical protein [Streptomyces sp. NBC_01239]
MDKIAFVAMKFESDPWRDKKYQTISDVLSEAGFKALRADEIRTSGVSMDEVTNYFRKADLVVVDLSGQSLNVSYELGFCHGIGRDPEGVILLCKEGVDIPFNYAHYRHNAYKDLRHLRTTLRYRLGISTPLKEDQLGYAFSITDLSSTYGATVAEAVVDSLRTMNFTGRCEYYAGDPYPGIYVVGLAVKGDSRRHKFDDRWWMKLRRLVAKNLEESESTCRLDEILSEYAEVRSFRQQLLPRGVAEFADGHPKQLLRPAEEDSWFSGEILDRIRPERGTDQE